jgi:hypothetical protein
MAGFTREVAIRVFAQELRDSVLTHKDSDDQFAPTYLITPTGARANRVFLVGTVTELDNIGSDTDYYKARITDPTGSIHVYAGQYQPEAARVLAGIEPPAFVAIVGKPSVFETDDGTRITSIRVESAALVDKDTRDAWVKEAAELTTERINGFNSPMALEHYGGDLTKYKEMVLNAIEG